MADSATARHNMVESQIRTNKVTDARLTAAMLEIPRERFLPKGLRGIAYIDEDIPLGGGRHMMEPMVFARLLQIAEVRAGDVALDIGCGPGYSAAVLARLCDTVVAVESDAKLASEATKTLAALDIDNAAVIEGSLQAGCAKQGPYDLVLFDGAISGVPETIQQQVAEGGRIVAVIGAGAGVGRGSVMRKAGGTLHIRAVFDAAIPSLPGFEPATEFVF